MSNRSRRCWTGAVLAERRDIHRRTPRVARRFVGEQPTQGACGASVRRLFLRRSGGFGIRFLRLIADHRFEWAHRERRTLLATGNDRYRAERHDRSFCQGNDQGTPYREASSATSATLPRGRCLRRLMRRCDHRISCTCRGAFLSCTSKTISAAGQRRLGASVWRATTYSRVGFSNPHDVPSVTCTSRSHGSV